MREEINKMLERVRERPPAPELRGVSGVLRFDSPGASPWDLAVRDGTLALHEGGGEPDCTIRCEEADLAAVLMGRQNLLTAAMQGRVQIEGDLVLAQRFLALTRAPSLRDRSGEPSA